MKIKFNFPIRVWLRYRLIMRRLNSDPALQLASFIQTTTSHPEFLKLVALGRPAIPFLLRDLRKIKGCDQAIGTHTILCALALISGENVIPADHRGRITQMQADWLNWGRIQKLT